MTTTASNPGAALHADPLANPLHGPVLLASDGRGATDAAPIAARFAAEHLRERLEVLAVLPPLPVYALGYEVPTLPPDFEAERRADLHAAVRSRLEPVLGSRERWHVDVRYGPPARVIADVAREMRAGLVVLGTGGHRTVDRLFGDEVSLQVVRHASTPVLAVAPDQRAPMRRAVVGMDFGAASIRAAQAALALIDPGPAGTGLLTLVHVRSPLENSPPTLATWAADYDLHVVEMFSRLRDMLRPYVPDGVTVETRTPTGGLVEALKEVAAQTSADFVAVGTHGPGWVERLFVGSVAASTLRQAGTTVLVAPAPEPADRVRLELRVAGQVTLDRPTDWAGALDALTRRNALRRARLELSAVGMPRFAVEAARWRFLGASYDPHDRRVEIMLGDDVEPTRHITHGITRVRAVEIVAEDERHDRALLVEDERGHAVLTFIE